MRWAERCIAEGLIAAEDICPGASSPVCRWRVDCRLDVATVEVDDFSWGNIVAAVYAAEDGPGVWTCLGYVIDIETRIDFEKGGVEVVEEVAVAIPGGGIGAGENGERARRRRVLEVFVEIGGVSAGVLFGMDGFIESAIQEKEVGPVVNEG